MEDVIKKYIEQKNNIKIIKIDIGINKINDNFYNVWYNYYSHKTNHIEFSSYLLFKSELLPFIRLNKINKLKYVLQKEKNG